MNATPAPLRILDRSSFRRRDGRLRSKINAVMERAWRGLCACRRRIEWNSTSCSMPSSMPRADILCSLQWDSHAHKLVTTAGPDRPSPNFFPLTTGESIVDPETLLPEHLTFRRREGKKERRHGTHILPKKGNRHRDQRRIHGNIPILPHTKDAISCLYYVRSELTQGQNGP